MKQIYWDCWSLFIHSLFIKQGPPANIFPPAVTRLQISSSVQLCEALVGRERHSADRGNWHFTACCQAGGGKSPLRAFYREWDAFLEPKPPFGHLSAHGAVWLNEQAGWLGWVVFTGRCE